MKTADITASTATLLVELVTEELPPKALKRLGDAFTEGIHDGLVRAGLADAAPAARETFCSPRRLAVAVTGVRDKGLARQEQKKLMPVRIARTADGRLSDALVKRLDKEGLPPGTPEREIAAMLAERDGDIWLNRTVEGVELAPALQAVLDDTIAKLPIPKLMSYQRLDGSTVKFVRPAHRLVALHGADVVPVRALDLAADRVTAGHRFLGRRDIALASADAYAPTLEAEGKVIASFAARRAQIVVALEGAAGDASVIMPDALLDEVTALVEWPAVYVGTFDAAFLAVPQECLILTMQLNQRYFALADDAGRLVNRFLLVSNIATQDPAAIVGGNERVLRARLADAKFFFDQDRKQTLASRVAKLDAIVYHNKLGSQGERVTRLRGLAAAIAAELCADSQAADRAALLAKADLVTEMVAEFPELQGLMGCYYARYDGEPTAVADAIEQHYWPRFAGDALPAGPVAQSVALADKLDTLVGIWGIGLTPTGDKDPFALRRHALGVLRMMVEQRLPLSLPQLLTMASSRFPAGKLAPDTVPAVYAFMLDRLRTYLREQLAATPNEVEALLADSPARVDLLPARLAALQAFGTLPEAAALSAANKRIVNILRKSGGEAAATVDAGLLAEGAERDLHGAFNRLAPVVDAACAAGDYASALKSLAAVKPIVDRFFDAVMVMADDAHVRANRLALLRSVATTMNRVADISKLAA